MYSYKYQRAALTTDAIVFFEENNEKYILLIERGKEPFKNKWALPGGFVEIDELLEEGCKRELFEETGLRINKMKQFRTYDAIDRDPRHRTISVVFSAKIIKKEMVAAGDDATRAQWFSLSDLPEMAFDHKNIISDFFYPGNSR